MTCACEWKSNAVVSQCGAHANLTRDIVQRELRDVLLHAQGTASEARAYLYSRVSPPSTERERLVAIGRGIAAKAMAGPPRACHWEATTMLYCLTHGFYRREGEIKCSPQNTYLPPDDCCHPTEPPR